MNGVSASNGAADNEYQLQSNETQYAKRYQGSKPKEKDKNKKTESKDNKKEKESSFATTLKDILKGKQ